MNTETSQKNEPIDLARVLSGPTGTLLTTTGILGLFILVTSMTHTGWVFPFAIILLVKVGGFFLWVSLAIDWLSEIIDKSYRVPLHWFATLTMFVILATMSAAALVVGPAYPVFSIVSFWTNVVGPILVTIGVILFRRPMKNIPDAYMSQQKP